MKSTTTTTTGVHFLPLSFCLHHHHRDFRLTTDVDGNILRNGGGSGFAAIPLSWYSKFLVICNPSYQTIHSNLIFNLITVPTPSASYQTGPKDLPARLSTLNRVGIISKGHLLNIEFKPYNEPLNTCVPVPSVWKLEEESQTVKVTVAKELDEIADGPFVILEHGDYYKLVYYDFVGEPCKDLGISVDNLNNRRLVVKNGDPLVVQFMRAHVATDDVAARSPNKV